MSWILGLLAIIICLLLVVGIHELGHALAARWCGVKIHAIAFGFGKPLWTWYDKKGRQWVWALWPLGGYVHLYNTRSQDVTPSQKKFCFDKKPIWMRIVILSAGIVANLGMAWLALIFLFLIGYQETTPMIAAVQPNSIAASAHLESGEIFLSIANQPTPSWPEVGMQLLMNFGKHQVPISIQSSTGMIHQTYLDLDQWHNKSHSHSLFGQMGLVPDNALYQQHTVPGIGLLQAMSAAWHRELALLQFYLVLIKQIVTGTIPFFLLLGPFSIFANILDSFKHGVAVFLYFMAHLNLVVAVVNILPIPALDGGSILYALIEKIRRKPMSIALEVLLYRLAFIALILLWAQLILNDLKRYLS